MARGMQNLPRSRVREVVLDGLTWTESFSSYRTVINGWLSLNFFYSDEKDYKISINNVYLKARASTVDDAASLCVRAARLWCVRAIEELDKAKEIKNEPESV